MSSLRASKRYHKPGIRWGVQRHWGPPTFCSCAVCNGRWVGGHEQAPRHPNTPHDAGLGWSPEDRWDAAGDRWSNWGLYGGRGHGGWGR